MAMRIETISEEKAGTITQCLGIAERLSPDIANRIIPVGSVWRRFLARAWKRGGPDPDLVLSCGRRAERPALLMKARHGGHPVLVHLQRPQIDPDGFDLVFVSRHDWRDEFDERANFHRMVGVPHRMTPERLTAALGAARRRFGHMPAPYAVLLVGGTNGAYVYDDDALARIAAAIADIRAGGWTVLVSTSRRSSIETKRRLQALSGPGTFVWDATGDNPLIHYFALADAFVVTKDSVTMPCEAASTGKPVYILDLPKIAGPKLEKFERFHADLSGPLGLTRQFEGVLAPFDYEPLDEAGRIAGLIARHMDPLHQS
jgi:mitochondrial fission protein ELM1